MRYRARILFIGVTCVILVLIGGIASGSKTIYKARFSEWPQVSSKHGYVGPQGDNYTLSATGNTWMGPGSYLPITPLKNDFILDISFQVLRKKNCSLSFTLSDAGNNYSQLYFGLDLWKSGSATFSVYENWVKNNFNVHTKRKIASRSPVPQNLATVVWTNVNTLSFKRDGNRVSIYCNNQLLEAFQAPKFEIKELGVGIAFESKVLLTSVVAKVPTSQGWIADQSCMGVKIGGYCWYYGGEDVSCNDVCESHGGYHEATRFFAGSDGSNANCKKVLRALGFSSGNFYETTQGGIGCFIIGGAPYRYRDRKPTKASATSVTPGRRRVCACQK